MQEDFVIRPEAVPLVLPVDLAGELIGSHRAAAYAAVRSGALPVLPGPGRLKVPTAAIERLCGRRITAEDIEAARARLNPKRAVLLKYQASYRAGRAAITAKKINRVGGPQAQVPPGGPSTD